MLGTIEVLNTTKGHLTLEFENPQQAKEQVTDLLRKGYVIIVEHDGQSHKVSGYDAETNEYLCEPKRVPGSASGTVKVPAQTTKPTAVAPSSGG